MVQKVVNTETIADGLDRHNLVVLKKRFLQINSRRLERTRSALGDRQQTFLDALPLLFHVNHPMLPGYVSRTTPTGVCGFTPDKHTLALGRTLARSFRLNQEPAHHREIEGLYLMGSVGTVAHSDRSDFDVWVCYKPGLSKSRIAELTRKCSLISTWAAELRLEVHFFPMDYEAFKQGQGSTLNEESSGSAQQLLLLDEFYRTALLLAGRMPLWWFVPASAEPQYGEHTHTLLHQRFLATATVLDFGGMAGIPNGEFMGAGIWQLYKAIASPYKSVLKLLLLEAYVSEYPRIEPLSLNFKKKIYAGELDIDELDSYIMIYRRIEHHLLARQQPQRLELARRCLYFKINKPLTLPLTGKSKSWQRRLLERLTAEWGWSHSYLSMLDQRAKWKADRVAEERALLVSELNHSYRFLSEFANSTGATRAISTEELTILGRKLHAAFERRPGKIDWINPGISNDLSEPIIALRRDTANDATGDSAGECWTAAAPLAGVSTATVAATPFKQAPTLTELLLWCVFNGVIQNNTHFDLSAITLTDYQIHRLVTALQQWLPSAPDLLPHKLPHKLFQKAAAPTHVLLLINVDQEPQANLHEVGMHRTSNRMDALRYSGFDHNLVMGVDVVMRNSWQEISCTRFAGEHALLGALKDYLSLCLPASRQTPPQLTVTCIGASHSAIISQRVQEWFEDISACYYSTQPTHRNAASVSAKAPATRYLFAMGGSYYSLQFRNARLNIERHRNEPALLRWLGREQPVYSPFVVDKRATLRHPLQTIAKACQAGAINVFYMTAKQGMQVYVIDEVGSLVSFVTPSQATYPLTPMHRFLRAVTNRQVRSEGTHCRATPICFFELCRDGRQQLVGQPRRVATEARPGMLIDLKAAVSCDNTGHYRYSLYCEQQEFSYLQHRSGLFQAAATYIRSLREAGEDYPVYLSDLDLDMCRNELAREGRLQTSHYLRLKLELEQRLNGMLPASDKR